MNIQYLNQPPYPNRWMITLIQKGSVCDLESSEPGCQEGVIIILTVWVRSYISAQTFCIFEGIISSQDIDEIVKKMYYKSQL